LGALWFLVLCVRSSLHRRLFSELGEFTENILGAVYALRYQSAIRIFFYFALASGFGFLFPALTYNIPSEVIYPFSLSVTSMVFLVWTALSMKGVRYVNNFVNDAVPRAITKIFFLSELLSTLIRVVSLGLRMFANAVAGSILVKIFFYLIFTFIGLLLSFGVFAVPCAVIGFFLLIMETIFTVLQAFIFTLLLTLYLKESLS
jgi:F0F1-type ATP synthase membrane subunit a